MKKLTILCAILLMACLPASAQFPQVEGDPIDYSRIRYPHYPGSFPATFMMEIVMFRESVFEDYPEMLKGNNTEVIMFNGELIKTKEINYKMLQNAINWGFNESGIRDRRHLQQLIDQVNAVIRDDARDQFWENMQNNASNTLSNVAGDITGTSHAGNGLMAAKYAHKIVDLATGRNNFSQAFLNSGTASDAASIGLQLAGAAAETAEATNGLFFLFDFWKTFFDEYYEATSVKPARTAAMLAAKMINKFYDSVNKNLRDIAQSIDGEKWMIYFKGKQSCPFVYYDEKCSMSLSMVCSLDKLWPVDDDRPDAEQRFHDSFEGSYFGYIEADQTCDMQNFDKNYIITDKGMVTENSNISDLGAISADSPLHMRQNANMWYQLAVRHNAEGERVTFKHETKAGTAFSAHYSMPVLLTLKSPSSYQNKAYTTYSTLDGEEEIGGDYPKMEVTYMRQTYDHIFTVSDKTMNIKEEETMKDGKMVIYSGGKVIKEDEAEACLIGPPRGTMCVNLQQSIADGTFSKTK
ncbi:MAG: hypothetical protein MJY60_01535 [Bacteroidales bacterium]|nr:hypothetical protein [Bacteroidales bacterium]